MDDTQIETLIAERSEALTEINERITKRIATVENLQWLWGELYSDYYAAPLTSTVLRWLGSFSEKDIETAMVSVAREVFPSFDETLSSSVDIQRKLISHVRYLLKTLEDQSEDASGRIADKCIRNQLAPQDSSKTVYELVEERMRAYALLPVGYGNVLAALDIKVAAGRSPQEMLARRGKRRGRVWTAEQRTRQSDMMKSRWANERIAEMDDTTWTAGEIVVYPEPIL